METKKKTNKNKTKKRKLHITNFILKKTHQIYEHASTLRFSSTTSNNQNTVAFAFVLGPNRTTALLPKSKRAVSLNAEFTIER